MPNWCECDLEITYEGENTEEGIKEINRFQEYAKTGNNVLDTEKFFPYPERFKKLDEEAEKEYERIRALPEEERKNAPRPKDGFNQGGYEWCINNWGTKWGICHADLVFTDYKSGVLTYSFDSAWSPPEPVIEKMAKMFPSLRFCLRYFEGGAGFNGIFVCENGEITNAQSGDYFGNRGG